MSSKIIIYDDSCPLCAGYTNVFIKTGLLDKAGRKNFSQIDPGLTEMIDLKRAVNEIPLIDTDNNKVWYGVDALLEILQQKIPFAKKTGNIRPVKWLLKKTYKLVSFNRRVIVAGGNKPGTFDCSPDFNSRYRVLFIVLLLCLNFLLLLPVQQYVLRNSLLQSVSLQNVQLSIGALVIAHLLLVNWDNSKRRLDLLAQVLLLISIALLLLLPLVWLNQVMDWQGAEANNFYLGALAVFATQEYVRRMRFAGLIGRSRQLK